MQTTRCWEVSQPIGASGTKYVHDAQESHQAGGVVHDAMPYRFAVLPITHFFRP